MTESCPNMHVTGGCGRNKNHLKKHGYFSDFMETINPVNQTRRNPRNMNKMTQKHKTVELFKTSDKILGTGEGGGAARHKDRRGGRQTSDEAMRVRRHWNEAFKGKASPEIKI